MICVSFTEKGCLHRLDGAYIYIPTSRRRSQNGDDNVHGKRHHMLYQLRSAARGLSPQTKPIYIPTSRRRRSQNGEEVAVIRFRKPIARFPRIEAGFSRLLKKEGRKSRMKNLFSPDFRILPPSPSSHSSSSCSPSLESHPSLRPGIYQLPILLCGPHPPPPTRAPLIVHRQKKGNGMCWGNWQPFPKRTRVPERKINLRGDEGEAPRHSSGGLHHIDAIFNKPPPTGASEFLSLIASHPFYPASRKKENQNRVRTPGQEKRMELEELELDEHQPPSEVQRSSVLKMPASRVRVLGLLIWPRERPGIQKEM